jgi:hypothetical protein
MRKLNCTLGAKGNNMCKKFQLGDYASFITGCPIQILKNIEKLPLPL